jgi:hypothetical protein
MNEKDFADAIGGNRQNLLSGSPQAWDNWAEVAVGATHQLSSGHTVTLLEKKLGDDDGPNQYMIFEVSFGTEGKTFFRKAGYYSSYDDGEWYGEVEQVYPQQVTKTEWSKK